MNILVTGGAGFIGSHVAERLAGLGHNIVIIDDFNDYYNPKNKRNNLKNLAGNKNVKIIERSICDEKLLSSLFEENKFDIVVHFAARAGVRASIEDPVLYEKVNVGGTYLVYEMMRRHSVKNIIFASSSSVYGEQDKVPFSENDSVSRPISPYAATKKAGEEIAFTYFHLYNINSVCLRFFTVYGERGRPDMAPWKFVENILLDKSIQQYGNGSSLRDYTYISDIVDGILSAIDKVSDLGYEIINLGNGKPIALSEFIKIIEKITGKKANIQKIGEQQGDVKQTHADISKAKKLLGYEPKVGAEEGLARFVEWYKKIKM
jgi:UDP-glucuronate 4-epimerase